MNQTPNLLPKTEAEETFARLNEAQKEAVFHTEGPCLVIAGAGTGKTSVLTSRIVNLLKEGYAGADEILAVTFTDKAAEEMRERVDRMMELGYEEVCIATFHGLCEKILRERGFEIGIDPQFKILAKHEQYAFLKRNLFKLPLDYYRPLGNPTKFIDLLLSYFSRLKDEDIDPEGYAKWVEDSMKDVKEDDENYEEMMKHQELSQVYTAYQQSLIEQNSLDFNDLISYTIRLLRIRKSVLNEYRNRFKYIMVDEFQDTNYVQSVLMYLLAAEHRNIMVVGDDDQAIYRFRGASVSNILQFEEQFEDAKKVVLTENYRSRFEILDLAYRSIQFNNPDRLEVKANISKELKACSDVNDKKIEDSVTFLHAPIGDDEVHTVTSEIIRLIESEQYSPGDMALLLRSNAGMEPFVQAFEKRGIPFKVCTQQSLFDQSVIKNLLSVLRVASNPYNDIAWFRVLKMEEWGISMEALLSFLHELDNESASIWPNISKLETTDKKFDVAKVFGELMDYSREHNVGEVLHHFVHEIELFQTLQAEDTQQSYEAISHVSQFFEILKQFTETHQDDSIADFLTYIDILQETRDIPATNIDLADDDSVSLLTIHSSKGLEFPVVFVPHLVNGKFPTYRRSDPLSIPDELVKEILPEGDYHLQEERRLFYVACTRAKEKLYLSWSETYSATSKRKRKRSSFIEEILSEEKDRLVAADKAEKSVETNESAKLQKEIVKKQDSMLKVNYSQLQCFENCPRQFEYRYMLKIPQRPSAALSFGSTLHNTLNKFYKLVSQHQASEKQPALFETADDVPLQALSLETLLAMYEESWIPYGYESRGHMETRKIKGREILEQYYETFKDYFGKPLYLEKSFSLPVGKYRITGRIDRVDSLDSKDQIVEIFDYKTGRTKTQKDVDKDLQLSIYAMAAKNVFGKEVAKLSLYFLNDNEKIETIRGPEQIEEAQDKIIQLVEDINTMEFEPKPDKIKCKYCDYCSICDAAVR